MTDARLFQLGPSRVCVSTVGLIPKMRQMMRDVPGVRLALSLHAPNQDVRVKIVPTAKIYPLDRLMDAVDEYLMRNDRIMIEYILISQVNDTLQHGTLYCRGACAVRLQALMCAWFAFLQRTSWAGC